MSSNSDLVSVKELASKLKVSDALLKKIIKDFGIETEHVQKRIHVNEGGVKTLREILALRASGKKNKEIKEMFDASQADKAETSVTTKTKTSTKETKTTKSKESTKDKKTDKKTSTADSKKKDSKSKKTPRAAKAEKSGTQRKPRSKKQESEAEDKTEAKAKSKDETAENPELIDGLSAQDLLDLSSADEEDVLDASAYLDDKEEKTDEELTELLDVDSEEDLDDLDDDEEIEEAEEVEGIEQRLSPRKIRRRQFSFRYIQRQITNDSKRINYIKQKLRRGRISVKEKMALEDSLHHRSVLLSGWVKLLRWVKS